MKPADYEALKALNPCSEALAWAGNFDTLAEAWAACGRGDWMLWLAGKLAGKGGSDTWRTFHLCIQESVRFRTLHECADIVRRHYPTCPLGGPQ